MFGEGYFSEEIIEVDDPTLRNLLVLVRRHLASEDEGLTI
jgi:hypothetical protein